MKTEVCFSQFNLRQRFQIIWFILMGRSVTFCPIQSKSHADIELPMKESLHE